MTYQWRSDDLQVEAASFWLRDDDDIVADEANISTEDGLFRCQADASALGKMRI